MKEELKYIVLVLAAFGIYISHTYLWQSAWFQFTYVTLPISLYGLYRYVRYIFNI